MTSLLSAHRCHLTGWIIAWAAFTYLSAAAWVHQTSPTSLDLQSFASAVWQTADAVPPAGKLSFGGVLALLLIAFRWSVRIFALPIAVADIAAGIVTVPIVILLAPVDYYPDSSFGAWLQPHLLCGATAGLLFHVAVRRCEARRRLPRN